MQILNNIQISTLGKSNIFKIKDEINNKFIERNLPYRIYTEVSENIYNEYYQYYEGPYVIVSVNLKTEDHGYYTLNNFKLTSNMCELYDINEVMKMVLHKLKVKPNMVQKVEDVHKSILKKTFNILSSLKVFCILVK